MSNTDNIRIELGGEVRYANDTNWMTVADELVKAKGGGNPTVTRMTTVAGQQGRTSIPVSLTALGAPKPPAAPQTHAEAVARGVDTAGEIRSSTDFQGALAGGFSPAQTMYRRGTPVIALGVENATASRQAHDKLPTVDAAMTKLIERVKGEERTDRIENLFSLRMDNVGRLAIPAGYFPDGKPRNVRIPLAEDSFSPLMTQLGVGGAQYLSKCWASLRATNFNNWAQRLGEEERQRIELQRQMPRSSDRFDPSTFEPEKVKLRTRKNGDGREVFAVVTPSYTSFDIDKIAEAVRLSMPRDARAEVSYDGFRSIIDVRFHTDVEPAKFVAGEFFKAGIRVRTSDIGNGAINVRSSLFQNLCLNLLCIDQQTQGIANIRHVGSVVILAQKFREALEKAKHSLAHFLDRWNYCAEEKVTRETIEVIDESEKPMTLEQLTSGIFEGLRQRELVPLRKADVPKLVEAHKLDTSYAAKQYGITRTTVANAVTRFAHSMQDDFLFEDELERAAGQLLWSQKPLPYASVGA
jgi:hypothetical protein